MFPWDFVLLAELMERDCTIYDLIQYQKEKFEEIVLADTELFDYLFDLEQKKLIVSYIRAGDDGEEKKFYMLTEAGSVEFRKKLVHWKHFCKWLESANCD